jgi:hypothetical protein
MKSTKSQKRILILKEWIVAQLPRPDKMNSKSSATIQAIEAVEAIDKLL